jgi:hypothetical protein
MDNFVSGDTVTSELAISWLSATLVATTVTLVAEDTVGAVKRPALVIVPPLACHITPVSLVEVRVAENWICPPEATSALAGDKFIWTDGFFAEEIGAADDMPAHPVARPVAMARSEMAKIWLKRRCAVLLVWKPGDDSKNIFALTN